jgi:Fic family protein
MSTKKSFINIGWTPNQPFNDLPPLPPKTDLESKRVLKACISARTSLEGLRQGARLLPNQGLLINLLPILEAKGSSEIENIVTTTDQLFKFSQQIEVADPPTKEALLYRTALNEGAKSIEHRPLCTKTALEVCSTIKSHDIEIRRVLGTAPKNMNSGETIYTPPEGEHVLKRLLSNWERYLHMDDDLDPLIKMAVSHYQFEAIHPFGDGNGRTGRIMNILFLMTKDLLDFPILYLSRHIVLNKEDYYSRLLDVTKNGSWEPWIIYMLEAVEQTSTWTLNKIMAVQQLIDHTRSYISHEAPKIYTHELVEAIFQQPYCRISNLVELGIAKRQTASVYLKELCKLGVLEETSIGKEKLFIHPKLLNLMKIDGHSWIAYS